MRKSVSLAVILSAIAVPCAFTSVVTGQPKTPPLKIGTFDSRGVALAFYSSEEGKKLLEEGGEPGLEARAHLQTFSTGTVTDIIEKIKTAPPRVAREDGVSLIVSKWQVAYKDPFVEYVDVTRDLVNLFNPTMLKTDDIVNYCKSEPVPIEKMSMAPPPKKGSVASVRDAVRKPIKVVPNSPKTKAITRPEVWR
ncbi:MAG: hypothetical protein GY903_08400 [Fuerstiella sp.]|nr:hypothetical protein [Fuerstiella sp.]MCP4854499.1 hypothetical protein [Fuerstiella sp.]